MRVEQLGTNPGSYMNIFIDLTVSCYGYVGAISYFAYYAGTMWVDLWESPSTSSYTLKHSIEIVALTEGPHIHAVVEQVYVEPGLMMGNHHESSDAGGVAAYADEGDVAVSGYSDPELSRIVNTGRYHDTLSVGSQYSGDLSAYRRTPAIKLHIVKGKDCILFGYLAT